MIMDIFLPRIKHMDLALVLVWPYSLIALSLEISSSSQVTIDGSNNILCSSLQKYVNNFDKLQYLYPSNHLLEEMTKATQGSIAASSLVLGTTVRDMPEVSYPCHFLIEDMDKSDKWNSTVVSLCQHLSGRIQDAFHVSKDKDKDLSCE